MRGGRLTVLGALTALGSLGTHMVVPSLPAIAHDLGASTATTQLAVSLYLLGIGVGQLTGGAASDAWGRSIVLKVGVVAFAIGAGLAGLATQVEPFLAARLLQALGGSAVLVACRAIVAEQAPEEGLAGGLASLSAIGLLSPAIAPTIGGGIAALAGWRAVFAVLAGAAMIGLAGVRLFPAIVPLARERPKLRTAWVGLLRDRRFVLWTAGNGLVSAAFFTFLTCSPFILAGHYRLDTAEAGLCYFAIGIAIVAGTMTVRRIERRRPAWLSIAGRLGLALGVAGLIGAALWRDPPLMAVIAAMMVLAVGSGLTGPVALAGALRGAGTVTGSAAALFGASQMLIAAGISAAVAHFAHEQPRMLGAIALIASCAILIFTLAGRRRPLYDIA